METYVHLPDIF